MGDEDIVGKGFNFSDETQTTVLAMVDHILDAMGRTDLSPIVLDDTPNEIPFQHLSAERARKLLSWEPRYDLAKGLAETVSWYKTYLAQRRTAVETS